MNQETIKLINKEVTNVATKKKTRKMRLARYKDTYLKTITSKV